MCIFTTPSVDVADTRLFARLDGERQVLVYEMSYAAAGDLAMVLPLPVSSREESAIKFIDLSACPDFFAKLSELIWLYEVQGEPDGTLSAEGEPARPPLRVHEVGAFDASFVPSPRDFDRLDARFKLPAGLLQAMPQYADYGFAVFRLRDTAGALKGAHPMAFDFATRHRNALFLPTVHVHDGSVHRLARFDHIAYLQGGVAFGNQPRYFDQGRQLEPAAVRARRDELWRNRTDHWKFDRSGEHFGVVWPAGPSEELPQHRAMAKEMRAAVARAQAMGRTFTPKHYLPPVFDYDQDLYALGMSGMLPNSDTLIPLAT